jgi:hypothetical protein
MYADTDPQTTRHASGKESRHVTNATHRSCCLVVLQRQRRVGVHPHALRVHHSEVHVGIRDTLLRTLLQHVPRDVEVLRDACARVPEQVPAAQRRQRLPVALVCLVPDTTHHTIERNAIAA